MQLTPTKTNLQLAVVKWYSAIDENGDNWDFGISDLAKEFNIPKQTLRDNIKRNSSEPPSKGRRPRIVSKNIVNLMIPIAVKKDLSKIHILELHLKKIYIPTVYLKSLTVVGTNILSKRCLTELYDE